MNLFSWISQKKLVMVKLSKMIAFSKNKIYLHEISGVCNFIKNEALTQVFSCEFCKIFKTTFLYRTPPVAAFDLLKLELKFGNEP